MAETLAKTGPAVFALAYGGTLPFTMYVYDFDGEVAADLRDWTAGSSARQYGTTGLVMGSLVVLGYLAVDSAYAFAATTVSQETGTGNTITMTYSGGTGNNSGAVGSGKPWVLYGFVAKARIKATKTEGMVAGLLQFQLSGSIT